MPGNRQSVYGSMKQPFDHIFQVKTAIKAITGFNEIPREMFLADGVAINQDGVFHVSEHGIDPFNTRELGIEIYRLEQWRRRP
jgi:hypothetical protein